MATLNLRNPNGYDGQPGTQYKQGIVRLATNAEAAAGTAQNVVVTPVQLAAFVAEGLEIAFASPPILGLVTPNTVEATSLSSTAFSNLSTGAGAQARVGNATGTVGFFGSAGGTRVSQAALTNSVTAGGTTGTIANYTDLSVYANDSAAIRNDIYQLSLALANVVAALRTYGLLA